MSKTIRNLTLLFATQIVLTICVWAFHSESNEHNAKPFITENLAQADKITVKSKDGAVTLARVNGVWRLPDYGNLLVANKKLDDVLSKLTGNKVQWPAATSTSAQTRFEVHESNAQKTLVFYSGDKILTTLYLGTSPSFRKLHARVNSEKDIYAIDFSQNDFPSKPEEWFNRSLLKFDGSINAIKTTNFNLIKSQETWDISPIQEGKGANQDAINNWAERFSQLVVTSRVDDDNVEQITVQNPVFTAELQGINTEGTSLEQTYAFYKSGEKYYIKKYGEPHLFEIAKYSVEPIIDVTVSSFVAEPNQTTEESATP